MKRDWSFNSRQPWEEFAMQFKVAMDSWKPSLMARMTGLRMIYENNTTRHDDAFAFASLSTGTMFDVVALMALPGDKPAGGAFVRLILSVPPGGHQTNGYIYFHHSLGAQGKDLGDLACFAMRQVDPSISFN